MFEALSRLRQYTKPINAFNILQDGSQRASRTLGLTATSSFPPSVSIMAPSSSPLATAPPEPSDIPNTICPSTPSLGVPCLRASVFPSYTNTHSRPRNIQPDSKLPTSPSPREATIAGGGSVSPGSRVPSLESVRLGTVRYGFDGHLRALVLVFPEMPVEA
jgi:hypothetical protein